MESAVAEIISGTSRGHDRSNGEQDDGEERDDGEEDAAEEHDIVINPAGVRVEREELLHHAGDEHDDDENDRDVEQLERQRHPTIPAQVRVRCPDDALGEDQVDDEENDDPRSDEDLGRKSVQFSTSLNHQY